MKKKNNLKTTYDDEWRILPNLASNWPPRIFTRKSGFLEIIEEIVS